MTTHTRTKTTSLPPELCFRTLLLLHSTEPEGCVAHVVVDTQASRNDGSPRLVAR